MQTQKSNESKQNNSTLSVQVSTDLTVQVIPNQDFEFFMPTKQVAFGYGSTEYAVRMAMSRNSSELIEGKHFVKGITICHTLPNAQPHQIFWTKRGVVRLGFFIKSERAKLFRDWAEDFIINNLEKNLLGEPIRLKQLTERKRKHNRLTSERMIDILHDVCMIEDKDLRQKIATKLKGGNND
jgi:hypothetical protein